MVVTDSELLNKVTDLDLNTNNAYNIRKNGKSIERNITDDVKIVNKEDGSGIDIFVKDNTKYALILIPVIITESGLEDIVYNDFHIGKNANATIIAGCAIKNPSNKNSKHQGIHRFYLEENSNVKYVEKHYGEGHGKGHKILDPITELYLKKGSTLDIDTVQIEGVDSTIRITKGTLDSDSTLTISEKIMTSKNQHAKTEFDLDLTGKNSSAHVISRAVATESSNQIFLSRINGNNECYGHVECDAILKDNGKVQAVPEVNALHVDAKLIHEATIGKIAGDQLIKLMSLGMTSDEAEKIIIKGFLK
jgi:ABC-type transport system involved in Fe-S cluster assembly, permease component